jgi:AcrR family transcriptional regulator
MCPVIEEAPYHHGRLRSAVLAAAEKTLATSGVEGISLRQLAKDVGVSHAAPRYHFKDKQSLLDALAIEGFTRLSKATSDAADPALPLKPRTEAMVRAYVRFATANHELYAVMLSSKHHPEASESLHQAATGGMQVAVTLIAEGQQSGVFRPGDPYTLALATAAHIHGLSTVLSWDIFTAQPTDTLLTTSFNLVWSGLAATTDE